MIIKQGTTQTTYYVETDHQGSIIGLLNTNGTYAEKYSYDAWGRRRNTSDWTFNNVTLPTLIDRGYTGHEHLDKFGIINMNGRMYDPYLGRFLSVDPVIQSTTNSQTFNGYSYCLNNPLKFTDPTGYSYGNDAWTNPYSEHSVTEMMSGLFGQMAGDLSMSLVDQNSFWNYFETLASSGASGGKGETIQEKTNPKFVTTYISVGGAMLPIQVPIGSSEGIGDYSTESLAKLAPKQNFSGILGEIKYFLSGGNVDGFHYNMDGNVISFAPITGMAPTPMKLGSGLTNASSGLKLIFNEGLNGNSIINIRNTLLNNGFIQTLTRNKSGYLFINEIGEQVRIMSRFGKWDIRVMNQFGNYLDEFGNVAIPGNTHNIIVWP